MGFGVEVYPSLLKKIHMWHTVNTLNNYFFWYDIPWDPCMGYLHTYIYHKHQPNVGKYIIHGSYGYMLSMEQTPTCCHIPGASPSAGGTPPCSLSCSWSAACSGASTRQWVAIPDSDVSPKISGFSPQIIHFNRGFPIRKISILGGTLPLFLGNTHAQI